MSNWRLVHAHSTAAHHPEELLGRLPNIAAAPRHRTDIVTANPLRGFAGLLMLGPNKIEGAKRVGSEGRLGSAPRRYQRRHSPASSLIDSEMPGFVEARAD
jgi:hypothetical protein